MFISQRPFEKVTLQHPKETDFCRVEFQHKGKKEVWDVTKRNAKDTSENEIRCQRHYINPLHLFYLPIEEGLTDLKLLPLHVRDAILRQKNVYTELYEWLVNLPMILGNVVTNSYGYTFLGISPIVRKLQNGQLTFFGSEEMLEIEDLKKSGQYQFQDPSSRWATTKDTGLRFSHPTYYCVARDWHVLKREAPLCSGLEVYEGNFIVESWLQSNGCEHVNSTERLWNKDINAAVSDAVRYVRRVS